MTKVVTRELEWSKAQGFNFSVDLVEAARRQLKFLAVIDSSGCFYQGPALDRAIYRYNYCWIPLLAKHTESPVVAGPLVVPLDCEWVWHSHRLNPVQYKADCEEIYGRVLDNENVFSTVDGVCSKDTELVWSQMYPTDPYNLEIGSDCLAIGAGANSGAPRITDYDLVSAANRESSFFDKVTKSVRLDDGSLAEAVARYKGFLHIVKIKEEENVECTCYPTYDIDLMWHTHQLYPKSYFDDLTKIVGKILDHNDRDIGNSKPSEIKEGFTQTFNLWEDTFSQPYQTSGTKIKVDAARCWCLAEPKKVGSEGGLKTEIDGAARCWCLAGPKKVAASEDGPKSDLDAARCWCLAGPKKVAADGPKIDLDAARCWCLAGPKKVAADGPKIDLDEARCWCLAGPKKVAADGPKIDLNAARCWCLAGPKKVVASEEAPKIEQTAARCWCLAGPKKCGSEGGLVACAKAH